MFLIFGLLRIGFLSLFLNLALALECPYPDAEVNTKVTTDSLTIGSIASYSCDTGYTLFGESTRTCGANGKWSGDVPMCATNVAWRKPTSQSSTAQGGPSENANDGDRGTLHDGTKCTETNKEESPWWSVDLLQSYEISSVRLTTRGCCGLDEISDLEVRVGNSENLQSNKLCAWHPGTIEAGGSKELKCARPMSARYVFVQMSGKVGTLSFCEVEVFSQHDISQDRCESQTNVKNLGLFNQTCYEFQITSGGSFDIASKHCQRYKEGSLVQGILPLTKKFLISELERMEPELGQNKMLWIGVQREPSFISRVWRWVDGSKVDKPTWGPDQPNNYNGEQNCVVLDGGRKWLWNDVGCNLNYLFWICQFKPSCGTPNRNENTTLVIQKKHTVAKYSCPVGNKVDGDVERTCDSQGFWSGIAPACKYIECGQPPSIDHGVMSLLDKRTTFEAWATYICAENYTMDGNATIACGEEGKWLPKVPMCLYSWCPELEELKHGKLVAEGRRSGDTATFTCEAGYYLVGQQTLSCELGGKWSGITPTCRFVDCNVPENVQNGEMTLINSTTLFGSIASYTCGADYLLEGSSQRICESNGLWSAQKPMCTKIDCGEPEISVGGYVTGYSFEVLSEVEYHCEIGHYMTGRSKRTCLHTGKWSGVPPNCTFVECSRVSPIIKGEIKYISANQATYLNSEVEYKCMPNYRLIGSELRTCKRDGKWSGGSARCEEIRCSEPDHPVGGRVTFSGHERRLSVALSRPKTKQQSNASYRVGTQVQYRCQKGFIVDGPTIRTCRTNGTWSATPPKCSFVDCGQPLPVDKGVFRLLSNETSYGSVVSYECQENWKVDGKIRRFCQENGTWSGEIPKCIEVLCPSLHENLRNRYKIVDEREIEPWNVDLIKQREKESQLRVEVDDKDRSVAGKAIYRCPVGQKIIGTADRLCKQHGVWEGREPRCEWVHCDKPKEIHDGRVHILDDSLVYGAVLEYFCLPKFFLNGSFNRTCTSDGTWSGPEPICTDDEINLSIFGDNTVDSTSNMARGSNFDGSLKESSYTGIYVGVSVSLVFALAVGLALLFFKTREKKIVKTQSTNGMMTAKAVDTNPPPPMTYGDLNDPSNNIYEYIPNDLGGNYENMSPASSFSSGSQKNYNHTYSNELPTYSNNSSTNGYSNESNTTSTSNGGVPYHISQRPRMPPPQPPQVPSSFKPATAVTVNGVSINTS